jgi:hypothetical protein
MKTKRESSMTGKKPDKKELARMKVMADLGVSASAIGKRIGRRHNTVIKYLRSEVYNDSSVNKLVALIKEKELADLLRRQI